MKKIIIFFSVILHTLQLEAQSVDSSGAKNKSIEKKLAFIEYKYISGEYKEAARSAQKLVSKSSKKIIRWTPYLIKAKVFQAYSYFAMFNFGEAATAFNEAEELSSKETNEVSKFLCTLQLSEYLAETGKPDSAAYYLSKVENSSQLLSSSKKKMDFNLLKAKILIKKGFINEALRLIEEQNAYRLEMASSVNVFEENSMAVNKKYDFILRKEKYLEMGQLKITALIASESYSEAEKVIENNKEWLKTNLIQSHYLYGKLIEKEAEISMLKRDYDKASSLYLRAYTATSFSEYEQNKIKNITQLIVAYNHSDQKVKFKKYLRRLQMYAFRKVGSTEPFQLAYEYSMVYDAFLEGDFTAANARLNRLKSNFAFLPPYHSLSMGLEELTAAIALKSGNVKPYKESVLILSEIKKNYYGKESPSYHREQLVLALFEIHYGKDFSGAEKILKESYTALLKKEILKESAENMIYLAAYAELFGKTDRYDSAMVKALEVRDISKNLYQEKSSEYLLGFSEYIEYQILSGKYKDGFENLERAFDLSATIKEGDKELLRKAFMIMATLYRLKGEFDRSQELLNKAYKYTNEGYEKQLLAEAEAYEQMASLYLSTGNYFRAEKSLLKSVQIKEDKLEENSPLLIHTYQELAKLNLEKGNYSVSDQYLKRATQISLEVFGKKSLVYADCYLIYAEYFISIGDLKKAEEACKEVDEIEVRILGKENLKRAETLSKLAFIRSKISSYKSEDVDKLYTEAKTLITKSLGSDNPLYANLIQKQAEFYISIAKFDKADLLLNEAEKYWVSKLGSDNKYVAQIILLRGDIAYSKSDYDQADKRYNKARDVYASVFNEDHPSFIHASGKLAKVYYMNKDLSKAISIMDEIIPKYLDFTVKYFPSMSFRQKQKYWNSIKDEFEFYNTLALNSKKSSPDMWGKAYNNTLATKAILLSSGMKILNQVMSSNDTVLIALYNDWVGKKEYLLTILNLSKQQLVEQEIDRGKVEDDISRIEKEMSLRSSLFSVEDKKKKLITWENVKDVLIDKEYAVEIIRYRYFNKVFTDSIYYASFVINKSSGSPELVLDNNGINMERRNLKYYRNVTTTNVDDEYSYEVYWKKIKALIPNNAVVYLSGDGVYNQINMEMLLHEKGTYALDENKFVFVSNTKDLLKMESVGEKKVKENKKTNTMEYLLCGSPDFYSPDTKITDKKIPNLPGTEKEIQLVNDLLVANGKNPSVLIKAALTEDTLKAIKNPKVIHIATHGYFKESTSSEDDDLANSPLLNSGILLYGSGDILDNPDNKYVNQKSGVLTAYEAMNLTLDNTDLVILSACETGRGEVQVGEGVAGLQRSFLLAGSKAIVVSLFKVNDEVTQKLMLLFYEGWLKTGDKRKAFSEAKKQIKEQYKSPVFWGAFMMIEGRPDRGVTLVK